LTEEKPNQKEKLTIRKERIEKFFPQEFTEQQKEDLLVQLLENWYRRKQREREHER
jgi:ParB family chromosome partitioning protein